MSKRLAVVACAALAAMVAAGCSSGGEETVETADKPNPNQLTWEGAKIFPVPPRSNNRLEVRFEEAPGINYRFEWTRNGDEIIAEDERSLEDYHFQKGDRIGVTVTGFDATTGVKETQTDKVTILNTAPVVMSAETFAGREGAPEVYLHHKIVDADDDAVYITYQWFSNDQLLEDETRETLSPLKVGKGHEVYCVIVASDGEAESLPFASTPVTMDNHAPRIGSNPPAKFNEQGEFIYALAASDNDGDQLSFELLEAPADMSIDNRGQIRWAPTKAARGTSHKVRVQVSDANGGTVVQEFNLSVPEESQD